MNKKEQMKFIENKYPAFTTNRAVRRVRHNFFEIIETEIQAYLLGFYVADGNINEKRKTLRVELQNNDSEIIYLYRDYIGIDSRMYQTKEHEFEGPRGKTIHAKGNIGIDINSSIICESLIKLGFGYRKSYSELYLPNIEGSLIRHFIRGYFDGDGSFTYGVYKDKNRKNPSLKSKFSIDSKTKSLLLDLQKFFERNDITTHIIYLKRDDMWRLSSASKKEVKKIFHLLYDESNYYLKRKFDKFNHYANTEVTQLIAEHRNA